MKRTLIAVALCSLIAGAANADPQAKAKAKKLYDEGLSHYNLAEYPDAIAAWKEAYVLSKAPLLLFNIGQAYRLSGDCTKANTFYDSYQREAPDPKNRDELEQAIEICKTAKPTGTATSPPTGTTTPPATGTTTPPATGTATPPATGTTTPPATGTTTPTATGTTTPTVTGTATPTTALPKVVADPTIAPEPLPDRQVDRPASSPGHTKRIVGLTLGGVGLVSAGFGIGFGIAARSKSKALEGYQSEWGPKQVADDRAGKRDAKLALGLGGIGVVAIGIGVTMYVLGRHQTEASAVAITPVEGGAQVAWDTTF